MTKTTETEAETIIVIAYFDCIYRVRWNASPKLPADHRWDFHKLQAALTLQQCVEYEVGVPSWIETVITAVEE